MKKDTKNALKEEKESEGTKKTSVGVYIVDIDMDNFIWSGRRKAKPYGLVTAAKTFWKSGALTQ